MPPHVPFSHRTMGSLKSIDIPFLSYYSTYSAFAHPLKRGQEDGRTAIRKKFTPSLSTPFKSIAKEEKKNPRVSPTTFILMKRTRGITALTIIHPSSKRLHIVD